MSLFSKAGCFIAICKDFHNEIMQRYHKKEPLSIRKLIVDAAVLACVRRTERRQTDLKKEDQFLTVMQAFDSVLAHGSCKCA